MTENMAAKGASKEGAATKTFWADHTVPRRANLWTGSRISWTEQDINISI